MRRTHLLWIASCIAIELSACTTFRPPPPRLDTAKACADWRWIGISRPEDRCPDVPGWTVRPLFPQLAPVRQSTEDYCAREQSEKGNYCEEKDSEKVPGPELIRELNRFCVYEVAHGSKWRGNHSFSPPSSAKLVRVDRDCAALSLSGETDLLEKDWRPHAERLMAQVGMPGGPFAIDNPFGVRLAFLDTEPTHESIPEKQGNSPHGFTLNHIARHIVCPGKSCAARITNQLALPIVSFDAKSPKLTKIDEIRGGFIGTQSDLAKAIRDGVDAWQDALKRTGAEQHLVLNLSLAWDGELFGGLDAEAIAELQAGTQAVYRVLQYAAAFDVLVLAAAGNQRGAPCANFGPLLPAAWEKGALLEESCGEPRETPLLYAVGGVQSHGKPIINARPGGMPRRAAYADKAVVAGNENDRPTAMLTGSSVGTAVASSIAAVVWSSFPKLSSKEVMDILDRSGEELKLQADFWFGSSASSTLIGPPVRRLSLCSALREACIEVTGSTTCLDQFPCPEWRPELFAVEEESPQVKNWVRDSCQPWLVPQPEIPPCLSCGPPDSKAY